MATPAPIASSGGALTAVQMIGVMIVGIVGSLFSYLLLARRIQPARRLLAVGSSRER